MSQLCFRANEAQESDCLKKEKKNPPALPYFALARYSNTTIFFGLIIDNFVPNSIYYYSLANFTIGDSRHRLFHINFTIY